MAVSVARALRSATTRTPLPRVPGLRDLYDRGLKLYPGMTVMVAGRSGSQKSGFVMWLVNELGLPCLYFSGDMQPSTAASRVAAMRLRCSSDTVRDLADEVHGMDRIHDALGDSHIRFVFQSPITWRRVDAELEAYVALYNAYPEIIVVDNLMDIDGCTSDYAEQMDAMQNLTALSRATGSMVIVTHHASEGDPRAAQDPYCPPGRAAIKNKLSEKPELTLTVALDNVLQRLNVAVVKQREGACNPTGTDYASLVAVLDETRFAAI